MSAAKPLVDHKLLRSLSPLCDLTPDMLTEISVKSSVEQVPSGATIFRAGDRDHRTLYLISGKLELTDSSGRSTTLNASSQQARQPLDKNNPRTVTAVSKGQITLLNIDTSLLEMLVNWGGNQSYEVSNLESSEEEETDWMSRFLQSRVFLKLRAENIQAMMMRMEEVEVKANDVIIKQGALDENYYIIAKGKAKVARKVTPDAPLMKLAVLTAGNGFGEEALIGNCKRNATVVMMEDGKLMRLSKADFIELLVAPVLQYLSYDEAKAMDSPDVTWLDVRKLDEYSRGTIPGAVNTPAAELRLGLRKLNKLQKYIVFSESDDLAASAAFLLNQNGLDAFVLKDGLSKIPNLKKQKPPAEAKPAETRQPTNSANVVNLHAGSGSSSTAGDRAAEIKHAARERVAKEMQRAQSSDEARKKALGEVEKLRKEVALARRQAANAEKEAKKILAKARTEVEKMAARKLVDDVAKQQAEREDALKRAEAEAAKAKMAEAAHQQAEAEITRLKQQAVSARRVAEEELRQAAARAQKGAEDEIIRLKAEAEVARRHSEEQARLAADRARSEAERKLAQQKAIESARYQKEMEETLKRAEMEAMRAEQSEAARRAAEDEAERMRAKAAETQLEMEKQARLAADAARSEAEREVARQRAEELAAKQAQIEEAVHKAEEESARAQVAEEEVERLRYLAEESRKKADAEIQRLKVDAEVARMQMEEQAQRVADAARSDTEREAARARAAEEARLQAEAELERLAMQAEQTRLEAEAQARLAADQARSEAEREAARLRAEELEEQQHQIEEIAERAEAEAERARLADEARQRAENEIARRKQEAEEAARRAEEEARRAWEAEDARRKMEEEMAQLRAEAEAARAQMEAQAREFAAAKVSAEEEKIRQLAEAEVKRRADEEAEMRKKEVDDVARKAADVAKRARQEAENLRKNSELEIKRLEAQAEAARIQAEIELKRSIAAARREVDQSAAKQKALARTRKTSVPQGNSANDRGQRARAARAAQEEQTNVSARDFASLESEVNELEEFFDGVRGDLPIDEIPSLADTGQQKPSLDSTNIRNNDNLLDPTSNDNLLDPTKDVEESGGEGKGGNKKNWISDDLAWEAAVGYRTDPSIERFDKEPEEKGLYEKITERKTSRSKPDMSSDIPPVNEKPKTTVSTFEAKEINRDIRPQTVKPTVYKPSVRGGGISKVKVMIVGLVAIAAVGGGAWFYSKQASAPAELKEAVNKGTDSLTSIKKKVINTIDDLKAELGIKGEVSEAEMAELRERLRKIKEESARSARELAKDKKVVVNAPAKKTTNEAPVTKKAQPKVEPASAPEATPVPASESRSSGFTPEEAEVESGAEASSGTTDQGASSKNEADTASASSTTEATSQGPANPFE